MKAEKTWILIANAHKGIIYSAEGQRTQITPVDGMTFESGAEPAREIMADRQGRSFDSVGGGRHAMEYPTDPVEQQAMEFAGELANTLQDGLHKGHCDRIALVAGPKMLAKLREKLSSRIRDRIKIEVDKDYVNIPIAKLPSLLEDAGVTG